MQSVLGMGRDYVIPTVDLSPFFNEGDEEGKKKAIDVIAEACTDCGFFQIVNHGLPVELMHQAFELSRKFFSLPDDAKCECSPNAEAPLPAGYSRQPEHSLDKNEYLLMFPPDSSCNVYPQDPSSMRAVLEEVFTYLSKAGTLIESIVNDCLGLPPNFLRQYNPDRSWDFMAVMHYFPATESDNNGITEHEDGNCFTFVFQDEAGGLQVRRDGQWIPVTAPPGTIIVNISDVIQVLSNNKFKSATHRVVRPEGKDRYSYCFFYNLQGDKWVEPLPQFTEEIGEAPRYRRFQYMEYQALRLRNKTHPPESPEDVVHITHYAIPS